MLAWADEDVDPIVWTPRRAGEDAARRDTAGEAPAAAAAGRLSGLRLHLKRKAHVVQHRVLHRHLKTPPLASRLALVECAQDADRHQHAGSGVAERRAGFAGRAIGFAGDAHRAAAGLRDHVKGEVLLVGAALAKTLDLAIDNARVKGADCI